MNLYADENCESQVSSTTSYKMSIDWDNRLVLGEKNIDSSLLFKINNNKSTLIKKSVNRGRWSKEEDLKLKELVELHGEIWPDVANHFPDRNDVQCQQRWCKVLNPKLIKGPWTQAVIYYI